MKIIYYNINIHHFFIILYILYKLNLILKFILLKKKYYLLYKITKSSYNYIKTKNYI